MNVSFKTSRSRKALPDAQYTYLEFQHILDMLSKIITMFLYFINKSSRIIMAEMKLVNRLSSIG